MAQSMAAGASAPIELNVDQPEGMSKGHLLLKTFLGPIYAGIPHFIILYILGWISMLLSFVSFFAILITGNVPRGIFDVIVGIQRWNMRVAAYMGLPFGEFLVDKYPPFSIDEEPDDRVRLHVEYPERLNRLHAVVKFFFAWLYVGIPHGIALFVYAIVVLVMELYAWVMILATGRYPDTVYNLAVGLLRWDARVNIYMAMIRDEYPKFSPNP